jgi:hypothetical protein
LIPIVALLIAGWITVNSYQEGLEERHQACLESIARMEPELFPDLPKELAWVEKKMSPYDEFVQTALLVGAAMREEARPSFCAQHQTYYSNLHPYPCGYDKIGTEMELH